MAITFLCTGCSHQLQVPDESAGAQAKCPVCGTVMVVPDPGAQAGPVEPGSPFASSEPLSSGSPFRYQPDPAFVPPIAPRRFHIGEAWSDTWAIYAARFWPLIGITVLFFVINIGFGMASAMIESTSQQLFREFAVVFMVAGIVIRYLFQTWIGIGLFIYLLNVVSGRNPDITDLFTGFRYLLRYIGAYLLLSFGVLAIIGVFALLVLGVYAAEGNVFTQQGFENVGPIFWGVGGTIAGIGLICLMIYSLLFSLWFLLLIDRDLGVLECLGMSAKLMRGNMFKYFVIQMVTGILVMLVGVLTCGIGFIFAVPFSWLLMVVLYYHIAGLPTACMYQEVYPR